MVTMVRVEPSRAVYLREAPSSVQRNGLGQVAELALVGGPHGWTVMVEVRSAGGVRTVGELTVGELREALDRFQAEDGAWASVAAAASGRKARATP